MTNIINHEYSSLSPAEYSNIYNHIRGFSSKSLTLCNDSHQIFEHLNASSTYNFYKELNSYFIKVRYNSIVILNYIKLFESSLFPLFSVGEGNLTISKSFNLSKSNIITLCTILFSKYLSFYKDYRDTLYLMKLKDIVNTLCNSMFLTDDIIQQFVETFDEVDTVFDTEEWMSLRDFFNGNIDLEEYYTFKLGSFANFLSFVYTQTLTIYDDLNNFSKLLSEFDTRSSAFFTGFFKEFCGDNYKRMLDNEVNFFILISNDFLKEVLRDTELCQGTSCLDLFNSFYSFEVSVQKLIGYVEGDVVYINHLDYKEFIKPFKTETENFHKRLSSLKGIHFS